MENKINKYKVRWPNIANTAKCSNMGRGGPGPGPGVGLGPPRPQVRAPGAFPAPAHPPGRGPGPGRTPVSRSEATLLIWPDFFGRGFQALGFWPRGRP